jgi:DNA-binding NarL/FixJ family response regulator
LAEEVVRRLRPDRYAVTSVLATRTTSGLPLGAFAAHVPRDLPDPGITTGATLRVICDALVRSAAGRRVALHVDDAHLLDDASAALVLQLVQSWQALAVVTIRTGEPTPEAIRALWKDELLDRFDVTALGGREAESLLEKALGGPIARATTERLVRAAGGNLLLLRELINACLTTGQLAEDGGLWHLAPGGFRIVPRLMELIESRIGQLDPAERQAMELIAFGEPLPTAVLDRLVDAGVVARLEERGLLLADEEDGAIAVRSGHPLYTEVLRARCSTLRTQRLLGALADASEEAGQDSADAQLRRAVWRLDAGLSVRTEVLLTASRRAFAAYDLALAERLARRMVEIDPTDESRTLLARILAFASRAREAESLFAATSTPTPVQDRPGGSGSAIPDEEIVLQATGRALNLAWNLDRIEDAFDVLDGAKSALVDARWARELDAQAAVINARIAQHSEAQRLAAEVLADQDSMDRARGVATVAVALTEAVRGRIGESLQALANGRRYAADLAWLETWLDQTMVMPLLFGGRLAEAEELMRQRHDEGVRRGDSANERVAWCARVGWALRCQGKVATALEWLREADAMQRDAEVPVTLALCELAHAAALAGEVQTARDALRRADTQRRNSQAVARFWVELARPWVSYASGEDPRPAEVALRGAEEARRAGAVAFEMELLHTAVRLGADAATAERLTVLAKRSDGNLLPLYAAHAQALAGKDAGRLAMLTRDFAAMGALLLAAETAAESARLYAEQARASSARDAAALSAQYAAICEGARTPALTSALTTSASPPALTSRERQIATLAASGLSSKQIADQLVTSDRTVDNHLQRVYRKLGIRSRSELAELRHLL